MRLVLGSYYLNLPGGAVTYFATVAEHLQKLGHDVTAFTRETGPMAERLEARGIAVAGPQELPEACEAVLVQDAPCSYELAERYPRAPQVFVSHGAEFDLELPPQVPGVVSKVVALNDRVRRRVEASALDVEVVRLRQPIDFNRFRPRADPADPPRRAVLLGSYLRGARRDAVTGALEAGGIAWEQLGRHATLSHDPAPVVAEADIVIGYGRSILEGMSAGCAAYVHEYSVDGWVTADSYPAMEADGFACSATEDITDPDRFARDLTAYDPTMGVVNRELVGTRHSPFEHATALAELLGALDPRPHGERLQSEMARLVRLQWEAAVRAGFFERRLAETQGQLAQAQRETVEAERRALEAEGRLQEVKASRRYRTAQRLAAPLERLRAGRRR